MSLRECTLQATDVSSHMNVIIAVIGFKTESIEVAENSRNQLEVEVVLFTPRNALSTLTLASTLEFAVEVDQNLSTATFGNQF